MIQGELLDPAIQGSDHQGAQIEPPYTETPRTVGIFFGWEFSNHQVEPPQLDSWLVIVHVSPPGPSPHSRPTLSPII